MRIWIISDTHFSHEGILKFRPADHEKRIKENLKKMIRPEDLLIHLGDVSLGDDHPNHNWFKRSLHCRTMLVIGNHDHHSANWFMNNGWDFACHSFTLRFGGLKLLFSHIPQDYNKEMYDLNIHGHLHDNTHRLGDFEPTFFNDRQYSLISMEFSKYQPILLDTILKSYERQRSKKVEEISGEGDKRVYQDALSSEAEAIA